MSDETKPALVTLAQAVAVHLPGSWRYTESGFAHSAHVRDDAGRTLYIQELDGRLTIAGHWQRIGGSCYMYADRHVGTGREFGERPSITVSPTKAPDKIAADIARRFLPAFVKLWDLAEQTKQATELYERKRQENAQRIAQAIGVKVGGHDKNVVSFYDRTDENRGWFEAKASDGTADIEAHNLPLDVAEAIARIVAGKVTREIIDLINNTQGASV